MNTPRRRPSSKPPAPITRWLPAIAAVAVLAVVAVAGAAGGKDHSAIGTSADAGAADPGVTQSATVDATSTTSFTDGDTSGYDVTGLTVPASTMPGVGTETTMTPTVKTQLTRTLFVGTSGDDVKQLQTRLAALGFVTGGIDGAFGEQTREAVWAYDKLILQIAPDKVDSSAKVTNETWQGMQDPVVIQPRRPGAGTHVEIYLPQQVAAVFTDDKPTLVIHISSGMALTPDRTAANSWCETINEDTDANGVPINPPQPKAVCGVGYTPGGVFRFQREILGHHVGALGGMDNPIYFNFGIAMHGAKDVPLHPASHGCIRMNKKISDTFQNYVHIHDRVYVWGQDGKEPEQYSKRESTPVFNYNDPNATTTTSTVLPTTATPTSKVTTTTAKPSSTTPTTTKSTPTTAAPTATTTKTTPTTQAPVTPTTAAAPPPTTAAPTPPTTAGPSPPITLKQ